MFKIQTAIHGGWADIKSCSDDDTYTTDVYETRAEATLEASCFPGFESGEYRVVPESTPSDGDIY